MRRTIRVLAAITLLSIAVQPRLARAEQAASMKGNVRMDQTAEFFQPQPLYEAEDNGINVLLDHAHQFLFFTAWSIPPLLREGGFRVISFSWR